MTSHAPTPEQAQPAAKAAGHQLLAALQQKSTGRFALQLVLDSAVAYERADAPDGVLYRLPATHFTAGTTEGHFEEGPIVVTWILEPEGDGMRLALEGTAGLKTQERLEPSGKQWQLWVELVLPPEPDASLLTDASLDTAPQPAAEASISRRGSSGQGAPSMSIKARSGQALDTARQAYSRGDYDAAARQLAELARAQPNDREVARWLARAQLAAGERAALRAWLEPRIGEFSQPTELRMLLARAMMEDGDVASATQMLAKAPPSVREDPDYHALLAAGYQQTGEWQRSAQVYRTLLGYNARSAAWRLGLGIALDQMGQAEDAARNYTAALALPDLDESSRRYAELRLRALRAGEQ